MPTRLPPNQMICANPAQRLALGMLWSGAGQPTLATEPCRAGDRLISVPQLIVKIFITVAYRMNASRDLGSAAQRFDCERFRCAQPCRIGKNRLPTEALGLAARWVYVLR